MRRLLLAAAVLALGGCHREPTFDERYKAAQTQIDQKAREIDTQAMGSGVPSAIDEDEADAK
ncbi:hypothetical protein WBP06_07510 [Novosphingobium sp. BL-8H]|uniref:hypothetical protein n=1 Tax=Novosphingobium sp. BL-8H TaxID=3127640 RepID=UPI00375636E9